ncbi:Scr1 family TA system antitoxin-like transcriptional regulator [Streptomyces telluris]|uniref:Scr1 family TA system antitoxin-like transcriptional regulator n=1 Tax=Streptomyces telluris TaxID=2720021 RepID=A0A9X2RSZ4_9ACTN|nr:Scr1 family TA system antitoxin-like transcriptional regulator [Streptomyces telluris]MCQ8774780.1 Scr1 family TA system antitoxin-like transcriptional regulator [Streptomyces telluris]NJP77863.1 hypothetical protein [Streptomyces telluris]
MASGAFPGSGQTLVYAEGAVPELDTVQVDCTHGPEFLYGEAQLPKYRDQLDCMDQLALDPEASRRFIRDIASQI